MVDTVVIDGVGLEVQVTATVCTVGNPEAGSAAITAANKGGVELVEQVTVAAYRLPVVADWQKMLTFCPLNVGNGAPKVL